ncbi:4-hydroxyphenylpyruvate dioxygenase-like protein [Antedon mediterranea]|uniref:4-hydroxyphenylpyruvate dioxygenase-like protein n=1 Tax=Antedon mediterranea TaxID=105859 RepID=UPI003AF4E635
MAARIRFHHFKICTKNGWKFTRKLVNNLQFQLFAFKQVNDCNNWVLRNGKAVFLVTEHCQADHVLNPFHQEDISSVGLSGSCNVRPSLRPRFDQLAKHKIDSDRIVNTSNSNEFSSNNNLNNLIKQNRFYNLENNTGKLNSNVRIEIKKKKDKCTDNYCEDEQQQIDSVYDVSFHVKNVEESFEKAVCGGAEPVCEPKIIQDAYGEVSIAAVRSCVGDVIHTLLNTENYTGVFLPGFTECLDLNNDGKMDQNIYFDHVTYVCPIGETERVLKWYEKCFGLKRLKINSDEDKDEGFVVRGNDVGMRLKAMEYWRCNSTRFAASDDNSEQPTNFVVAEALPGQGKNQIATFLKEHRGAGVQHIGLHTPDLVHTASSLRHSGLEFIQPPEAYYTEVGKLDEIIESGEEVTTLQKHGILLDAEADAIKHDDKQTNDRRYLMQVFTKPLFNEDTFFLEYIQRRGATGFGAGNITALWRAVQQYMDPPSTDELK